MKKLLSLFLAFMMLIPVSVFAADEQAEVEDDIEVIIEIPDALLVLDHIVGETELTGDDLTNADANGDGVVNVLDVQQLLDEEAALAEDAG